MNTGALKSPLERAKEIVTEYSNVKASDDNPLVQIITRQIIQAEEAMIERIFIKVEAETQVIVEMVRERAAEIAIHFSEMEAQAAGRIELAEAMKNEKMANLKSYKYGASDGGKEIAERIRAMEITAGDLKK